MAARATRFGSMVLKLQQTFTAIEAARVPVIAAIQGGCIGGGVDLISACDIRLCTADAFFSIQEINIGVAADAGTLQRLPRPLPDGLMRKLAYTGQKLSADGAAEAGFVTDVYETREEMIEAAHDLAAEIASKAPLAVQSSKTMINYLRDHSVADALDYMAVWQSGMVSTEDVGRAISAMKAKNRAQFDDLYADNEFFE